jgi:hypothetical protein
MDENNCFIRFLKKIDLYALPLEVRYRGEVTYSTKISIIFSFIVYILTSIILIVQLKALFTHENPQTGIPTSYILNYPLIINIANDTTVSTLVSKSNDIIEAGNYYFGYSFFSFQENDYITDISTEYFTIQAIMATNTKNYTTGKTDKIRTQLSPIPCQHKIDNNYFKFDPNTWNMIKKFNCLKDRFELKGEFISDVYKYLNIKVIKCDMDNKNRLKTDKPCKSKEEIDTFLKNGVFVLMEVRLYFDNGDFHNPVKSYFNTYMYSMITSLTVKVDHYLSKELIYSYDSLFPIVSFLDMKPTTYSYILIRDVKKYMSNVDSYEIINIYLRSDNTYVIYRRKYPDIIRVLALLCGLYRILFKISFILVQRINSLLLNMEVCNKIFKIVDPDNVDRLKTNPYYPESRGRKSCYGLIDSVKHYDKDKKIPETLLYECLRFEKYGRLEYSNLELVMYYFFLSNDKLKKKKVILNEAIKKYNAYKDVKTLFNFVIEFKRFMTLNVNRNQKILMMKFLYKTKFNSQNIKNHRILKIISKNIVKEMDNNNDKNKEFDKRQEIDKALEKYKNVQKNSLNIIDKRLLSCLEVDPRLLNIFVYGEYGTYSSDK